MRFSHLSPSALISIFTLYGTAAHAAVVDFKAFKKCIQQYLALWLGVVIGTVAYGNAYAADCNLTDMSDASTYTDVDDFQLTCTGTGPVFAQNSLGSDMSNGASYCGTTLPASTDDCTTGVDTVTWNAGETHYFQNETKSAPNEYFWATESSGALTSFGFGGGSGGAATTPPSFENSTPSQNSVSTTQIVIDVDINEAGTAYAVVVTDGAAAPSSAQVKAGQDSTSVTAISSNSATLSTTPFSGTITLTGLSASTAYDVYVVAQDDEATPNLQAVAILVDNITTSAPTNQAPVISNVDGDSGTYKMADPLLLLDSGSNAAISDADSADFDGGSLTVSIPVNRDTSEDELVIDTSGVVSLSSGMTSGSMVLVSSTPVGTIAVNGTGTGADDLIVNFDQAAGNATPARIATLIQAVGYQNIDTASATENTRTVRFVVNDGDGSNSENNDATITVIQNTLPAAVDSTVTATEDVAYSFSDTDFGYSDADSDPIAQVQITSLSAKGSLALSSVPVAQNDVIAAADFGNLSYTTALNENGTAYTTFGYRVHDGTDYAASANTMTIDVSAVNDSPTISGVPAAIVAEDSAYSFTPIASDVDVGDTLTFSITNKPVWASFSTTTGALTGTPTNDHVGTTTGILITVTDSASESASLAAFSITVNNTNDAPIITGTPTTSVAEDSAYSFTPTASDVDMGDAISFSISNKPVWASFDTTTGTLSGTPANEDVGTTSGIVISVTDASNASASLAGFDLTVTNTNDTPLVTTPLVTTVLEGNLYSYTHVATDVDTGDILTYSAPTLPSWLSFNTQTHVLSGTPTNSDVGNHPVVLRVSDGTVDVDQSFNIEVSGDNDNDGIADSDDPDDDNDGMTDEWENANGLDPMDASDANTDVDGDGVTNIDEYTSDSNPQADDYPPTITVLSADITVDAVGLFTPVDLDTVWAYDDLDGSITPTSDAPAQFSPGVNTITWTAIDAAGNSATATQIVKVTPMVNFSKGQVSTEGASVTLKVELNGDAVNYPVTVPYTVSGTAATDGSDHTLSSGSVTIASGREVLISFDLLDDGPGEGTETVTLSIGTPTNAVIGPHSLHTLSVVEGNVAPLVKLQAVQQNELRRIVVSNGGTVTVSALVDDPNPLDAHSYDWSATDNALVDTDGNAADGGFSFDPSGLASGLYILRVTVTDTAGAQRQAELKVNVVPSAPVLSNVNDTDGDGVSDLGEGFGDDDTDGVANYQDAIPTPSVLQEKGGESSKNLLQTEPGLSLSLSTLSFSASRGGAKVSNQDLVNAGLPTDDRYTNIGGLFDFEVGDLPVAGQSVQVVIPQYSVIPANAVYRKLMSGGWQEFVVDANNAVASAPGANGFCPPPGDISYGAGLTPGHWCVQLTLEDGGPNDQDGQVNNRVVDPGGVSVLNVSTSGGGGCSLNPNAEFDPTLLIIVGASLLYLRSRRRNKISAAD